MNLSPVWPWKIGMLKYIDLLACRPAMAGKAIIMLDIRYIWSDSMKHIYTYRLAALRNS